MSGHIHWKKRALALAFWTGLALSYALSSGLSSISEGYPPNWLRALSWNLSNFWLWMALVPMVGWLGRQTAGHDWRRLLAVQVPASHDEVDIVGECGNAAEAMQAVRVLRPDLLFLDIRMPGMDGFELLDELAPDRLPLVVFATAFADHALRAFDAMALDYVLKPIEQTRFGQAMARVNQHWQGLHATADPALEGTPADGYAQRLSVRHGEHIRVLAVDDIDWIRRRQLPAHPRRPRPLPAPRHPAPHAGATRPHAVPAHPPRHRGQPVAGSRGASDVQGWCGSGAAGWNAAGFESAVPGRGAGGVGVAVGAHPVRDALLLFQLYQKSIATEVAPTRSQGTAHRVRALPLHDMREPLPAPHALGDELGAGEHRHRQQGAGDTP
ncbi:hypothetical protein GCM10009126_12120 [Rhodanobacter caeni]|uniref:Response regulatory domain-containing protein n=1 Tax=Rhodanobacter caeni TaxID=657654 RepID=A0ABP3DZP9_9GAMM